MEETKRLLKGFERNTEAEKPDPSKNKNKNEFFSDPDYFKTVFISGDDMVKEMEEMKKKEIDDFNKKVVVDSQHFNVNTREKQKVSQLDKTLNVREDEVKKIGLRLSKKRL